MGLCVLLVCCCWFFGFSCVVCAFLFLLILDGVLCIQNTNHRMNFSENELLIDYFLWALECFGQFERNIWLYFYYAYFLMWICLPDFVFTNKFRDKNKLESENIHILLVKPQRHRCDSKAQNCFFPTIKPTNQNRSVLICQRWEEKYHWINHDVRVCAYKSLK